MPSRWHGVCLLISVFVLWFLWLLWFNLQIKDWIGVLVLWSIVDPLLGQRASQRLKHVKVNNISVLTFDWRGKGLWMVDKKNLTSPWYLWWYRWWVNDTYPASLRLSQVITCHVHRLFDGNFHFCVTYLWCSLETNVFSSCSLTLFNNIKLLTFKKLTNTLVSCK